MKDRSRFMSSLIVSLFAGFIYFLFGQNINEDVKNSIKEVFSSDENEEHYLSAECFSFNSITDNTCPETKKKSSKFYIKKRNTIEFKDKDATIPGDELFSDYVKTQAKVQKASPDKNVDFTAELDLLIKNKNSESGVKPVKEISKLLKKSENDEVADIRNTEQRKERLNKNFKKTQIQTFIIYQKGNADFKGNGFEYNYVTGEYSKKYNESGSNTNGNNMLVAPVADPKVNSNSGNDNNFYKCKSECNSTRKEKRTKTEKVYIKTNININEDNDELIEINIKDDSENEDSM